MRNRSNLIFLTGENYDVWIYSSIVILQYLDTEATLVCDCVQQNIKAINFEDFKYHQGFNFLNELAWNVGFQMIKQ